MSVIRGVTIGGAEFAVVPNSLGPKGTNNVFSSHIRRPVLEMTHDSWGPCFKMLHWGPVALHYPSAYYTTL